MKRTIGIALVAIGIGTMLPPASAQTAKDLVGAWSHFSNVNTAADGTKSDLFGPDPKGQALFSNEGRFAIIFHRAEMPKIAANNRTQGTVEENKAIVNGMISLYGSYTVADKVLVMKVEGSSFPNWVGTEQRRPIASFTADELQIINMGGSAGGRNEQVLKRIK